MRDRLVIQTPAGFATAPACALDDCGRPAIAGTRGEELCADLDPHVSEAVV
jgi:arginine repressor